MQTIQTDTVVIGSGISGIAAAWAVAQAKRKVILVDNNPSLGGNSVNANVGTICGAYYRSLVNQRVSGNYFTKFFLDLLLQSDALSKPLLHQDGLYIIPYQYASLQKIYRDLLKANQIEVVNGNMESIGIQDKKITSLNISLNGTQLQLLPTAIVDCSGNASVSQLAGLETIHDANYQAASQVFRIAQIGETNEYALNFSIKRTILKYATEEKWPKSFSSLSIIPGILRNNSADLKLTLPDMITDKVSADELRHRATEAIERIMIVLKNEIESLKHATIQTIFPQLGIRVLQRSKGQHVLTEEEVLSCSKSPEGIALGTWPIEEWGSDGRVNMGYFNLDDGYAIPAGCLISNQVDNLFFGGKNISATSKAIASARVMGTAWQTGYAAGKLSCAENKSIMRQTIEELHDELL